MCVCVCVCVWEGLNPQMWALFLRNIHEKCKMKKSKILPEMELRGGLVAEDDGRDSKRLWEVGGLVGILGGGWKKKCRVMKMNR